MPDFERSTRVAADPEAAFRFLADPSNLPRYVATMVFARPEEGEHLRVAAEVEGRHEEGEARFRTAPSQRRIEWGAEDGGKYGGWLQVLEAGDGATVTIHLHMEHDQDEAEVNRVLDETAGNIERLLDTR